MMYDRQKTLGLRRLDAVVVVGVGGVGSWVALDLALSGCVKKLVLCDPDTVEESNLNRTPYRRDQIGERKVVAMCDLISERRDDVIAVPFFGTVQSMFDVSVEFVVDCSDGLRVKEWMKDRDEKYLKLGYDAWSVTIDGTRDLPWGESSGYETVPSFVVPPQYLAAVAVGMILDGNVIDGTETFDLREMFKHE